MHKKYQTVFLSIQKGTKRKRHSILKKNDIQINCIESLICNKCKNKIHKTEICRILIMQNKDKSQSIQHIHFFRPCWNPELLEENTLFVVRIGFSIPEKLQISEKGMHQLENDLIIWD